MSSAAAVIGALRVKVRLTADEVTEYLLLFLKGVLVNLSSKITISITLENIVKSNKQHKG